MITNWGTYPIEYRGGLITNLAPLQHGMNAPGSAAILQNFEPSVEGGYKKILGYSKWNDEAVPGTGLVRGVILTSSQNLIAVRGGKYYTSTNKNAWVERLDLSLTAGNKIRHATFNFNGTQKVCMVDGVNKPVFWDSSDDSIAVDSDAPTDVQAATRVVNFKNHLFFSKGSNIVFTAPFAEGDYAAANGSGVINVGSPVVGLVVFREQLIVFSIDRIQKVVGNTSEDFALQPIAMNTGAFCGDTIQEVGGDILYLGPDGVRFLSATERIGDFALQRASEQVQSKLTNFFADCSNYSSVVIRSKSQYRLFRYQEEQPASVAKGFLGTKFLDQQSSGISWAEMVGIKPYNSDSQVFRDSEVIVFCNETDYIYQMESGSSFDGDDIEALFQTPFIPLEDPEIRKTYYKHTLYIKSDGNFNIDFNLILDNGDVNTLQPSTKTVTADQTSSSFWGVDSSQWGEFNWRSYAKNVYPFNIEGSGYTFALRFYDRSTNPSFSLDTSTIQYRRNDRK